MGDVAANWALTQLGKPYVWAADGPDTFDCSGLTMCAWEQAGVRLDHWTGTQWNSGPHIPLDQLRRGDLVFFGRNTNDPDTIHHVGIYIGRGRMVEAPYTGDGSGSPRFGARTSSARPGPADRSVGSVSPRPWRA